MLKRALAVGGILAVCVGAVLALYLQRHSSPPPISAAVPPVKVAEAQPQPARPAPAHEAPGSTLKTLVTLSEMNRVTPGKETLVQIPRPDGQQPHGVFVEASRRVLFSAPDLEIRETVSHGKLPIRIVEKVEHPGATTEQVVARDEMAPGHLVLQIRDEKIARTELTRRGFSVLHTLRDGKSAVIQLPATQTVEGALVALRGVPGIGAAEPDWVVHISGTPNDPDFSKLWGMQNLGQTGGTAHADIDATDAWDINTGNPNLIVAVIDTGIDYNHPDLAPNMWVNTGETGTDNLGQNKAANGVDDDGDGYVDDVFGYDFADERGDPKDDNLHGTHCAGTIGARGNNGAGIAGVCWNVKLMAVKFLDSTGSGYTSDAVRGIDFARTHGAKVMSNSWGGGAYSQTLYDAIAAANNAGILFVAAAGNDSSNSDLWPSYPASYALPNVISVAATDANDTLASFSNYGTASVDLGAPGVNIYSTFPTYFTTEMLQNGFSINYGTISGTSMATPHVSGAAALLWSNEPGLSVVQAKQRLLSCTDSVASLSGKCLSNGRLNINRALRNQSQPLIEAGITNPLNNARVATSLSINGVADAGDFTHYTLETGQGASPASWTTTGLVLSNGGTSPVEDGKLGDWHAAAGTSGTWTLRLTVFGATASKAYLRTVNLDPYLKPGFPTYAFSTGGSYVGGSSICTLAADLKGDGNLEVVGTALASGPLYAWDNQGNSLPGWPVGDSGVGYPAAAVLDGTGKARVAATYYGENAPWGIYDEHGQFLPGWPKTLSNFGSSPPVLTDLNGDGAIDVIMNQEARDVSAYTLSGQNLAGWPQHVVNNQSVRAFVAADVNNDGFNEVFAIDTQTSAGFIVNGWRQDGTVLPGWPVQLLTSAPDQGYLAVGDVDGDGTLDIIVVTANKVFVLNANGTIKSGWPFTLPISTSSWSCPPALADLNGDHIPEIIVASNDVTGSKSYVYALRGDGSVLPGWPAVTTDSYSWTGSFAPVVGDIDGDGSPDILMGFQYAGSASHSELMAWHANGTALSGFPLYLDLGSGSVPAIADIDHDGRNEVLVLSNNAGANGGMQPCIYAWDFNAPGTVSGPIEWGQLRGNSAHTGVYHGSAVHLRPFAYSQTVVTPQNQACAVALQGYSPQNVPLTYTQTSSPLHGTLSGTIPALTYTPAANYHGADSFTFTVNDGTWDSAAATVSIAVDTPPVAQPVAVSSPEDSGATINLLGSDAENDALTYTIVTPPSHGNVYGSGAARTYYPDTHYHGPDSFTYTVNDGLVDSNVATISLTITPVNHAPVANGANVATPVNTAAAISIYATDIENDTLTYSVVSGPAQGTLVGTLPSLQYVPATGYAGNDGFSYVANDGQVNSNTAVVSIKVNAAPVAQNFSVSTNKNVAVAVRLLATDANNDPLTYSIVTYPAHGTLSGYAASDGTGMTYTPSANYTGTDSFTFTAYDGSVTSTTATATIQISNPVDSPPVAANDSAFTTPNTPVTISVLANDSDPDGDVVSLVSFTQPIHGTATAGANSTIVYTPSAGFTGADVFTYTISDPAGLTANGQVSVSVGVQSPSESWPTMGNDNARTAGLPIALSSDPLAAGWTATLGTNRLRQVAINQNQVYAVCSGYFTTATVSALDANTGAQIWNRVLSTTSYIGGPTYADGKVFVQQDASAAGTLYSFDAASGNTLWSSPWNCQFEEYYAPLVSNSRVYIGGGTYGGMYGFNEATGGQLFFLSLDQYSQWTPVMYQNRLFSWVKGNFREHDPGTGAILWSVNFPGSYYTYTMQTIPVIANGIAYVVDGSQGGKLHAISLSTHQELWNAAGGTYQYAPAILNGVVYATRGSFIDAFDALSGQLIRSFAAATTLQWQPIVTQNTLFAASTTNTYVFNLSDGSLRQTIPYGGYLSIAGQRLYIATSTGALRTYTFSFLNQPPLVSSIWSDSNPVHFPATTAVHVIATDPENDPLLYTWSVVSGPGSVTFTPNGTAAAADSTAAFSAIGTYTLRVTIQDGHNTVTQDLVVQVLNSPPVITSVSADLNPVHLPDSTGIHASATDPENDPLTYTWSLVSGPASVTFGPNGSAAAANSTASFSAPGTYTLQVAVTDGYNSVTQNLAVQVIPDQPPVITNISASPNVVPETGTILSVTATDDHGEAALSYTWSATGPAPVSFDSNGLNQSKSALATFQASGSYVFTVTVTDADGLSTTSSVPVTVVDYPSYISVSPTLVSLPLNGTQTFIATAMNQFNAPIPAGTVAVSWSTTGGSVDQNGNFSAGTVPGVYYVTATSGSLYASVVASVYNTAPVIAGSNAALNAAQTQATLTATATDDAGESNLIYNWSATGPALVTFNINGQNAAKSAIASFSQAGSYTIQLTVQDAQNATATQSIPVTVGQTLTSIIVSPATVTLPINGTQTFTAASQDQFNQAMSGVSISWSATGGTVTAGGLYTAAATAGAYSVKATSGAVSGSASVTVAKGTLTGSTSTPASTVNLTTDGPTDWAHWGLTNTSSFDHKAGVTSQISNVTLLNTTSDTRTSSAPTLKWTDGTPTASSSGTQSCISVSGTNKGFQFTVPASRTPQHLKIYVAVTKATGKLQATLSDGSVPAYTDSSVTTNSGTVYKVYTLQFAGVAPGATLTVNWTLLSGNGSVQLESATLAP